MNKHTTKALITSVLSMLLCVSMLIGSTFAWFTDTASTGVNTIMSGNLDIALYQGTVTGEAAPYTGIAYSTTEVTEQTQLFKDGALWEPGYVEVAYLKVENKGNLALKYQLAVNVSNEVIGKSVLGNDIKLSEYIKMAFVEIDESTYYADRAAALEAAEADADKLVTVTKEGTMLEGAAPKYYAVIVYMPTTVGNEANALTGTNAPSIDLGITLLATQMEAEFDSFNNKYDEGALFPGEVFTVHDDDALAKAIDDKTDYAVGDGTYNKTVVADAVDVTINGGTFNNQVIAARNGGTVTVNDANAGSVSAGGGPNILANVNSGSTVIINGGSYMTNTILYGDGTGSVVINGGYFDCGSLYIVFYGSPVANLTITGGTFSSMLCQGQGMVGPSISDFVPDTHQIINNADGSCTVVAK